MSPSHLGPLFPRICLGEAPHAWTRKTTSGPGLPSASLHTLPYRDSVPNTHPARPPERGRKEHTEVSIILSGLVGPWPVQEFQPVVHHLRLSASAKVPTNPGRTNLPLETLGLRPVGFSPTSRYSYQHSHYFTVHMSLQSCFCPVKKAPLPIINDAVASVVGFSPGNLRRRITRPVSYYALFE